MKKIAGYASIKRNVKRLSFVRGEINNDLLAGLVTIEDALLNGAGGTSINGLLSGGMALPSFVAGAFAGAVQDANISDVIRIAKAQVGKITLHQHTLC